MTSHQTNAEGISCHCCHDKINELNSKLAEQAKINSELKTLLVGALGSDVSFMLENLAKDKLTLDRELNEVKNQVGKSEDNIDNLTAQADTWRSKYLALKIALKELNMWKLNTNKKLEEQSIVIRDMMKDFDKIWAASSGTYGLLSVICRQDAQDLCYIPDKPPKCSVVQIVDINAKLARCLAMVYSRTPVNSMSLQSHQPLPEPSSAVKKASNLLSSTFSLPTSHSTSTNGDVLIERFRTNIKPESDGPVICRGCKGNVIVL